MRGSQPGESHGGLYLLDLDAREVRLVFDCNKPGIDWRGHGSDRGLRGIALDGDTVFVAASDELLAFTPDFKPAGSWRNPYLRHCHGIAVWERTLFLASAAFDAILGFDLDRKEFTWAMQVVARQSRFQGRRFDPRKDDGPLQLSKLHINGVHCTSGGMYVAGLETGGLLLFNGKDIHMAVELPAGSRDARPFRDGVIFNDTEAGLLRYSGRDGAEDRAFAVPTCPPESLLNADLESRGIARPGFARGLAVLSDALVAGGSSPATVSVYDLPRNQRILSVSFSTDARNTVHSLAAWPY